MNRDSVRLSVIIPAYNSEKSVCPCVESVMAQEYDDMEIILVNDGSTDSTLTICQNLAARHPIIKVVDQLNLGLSGARNRGLEEAVGEFVLFIDSDDTLAPSTITPNMALLLARPECDLLEFPVMVHAGSERAFRLNLTPGVVCGEVLADWICREGYTHCYAWNKITRATLFENLRYPLRESFEDAALCPLLMERSKGIIYSDKGLYYYNYSPGGITTTYTFKVQEPLFRHNLRLFRKAESMGLHRQAARLWLLLLNVAAVLTQCEEPDSRYMKAATAQLNAAIPPLGRLLRCSSSFKEKIKSVTAALFGAGSVCRCVSSIKRGKWYRS